MSLSTLPLVLLAIAQDKTVPLTAGGPDLTRYLSVCGILMLSILALAWGFKKLVGGAVRSRAASRSLQVIDLLPLGGKQRLAVVRCYDRTFALGLGEKEVSLVAEIDPVHAAEKKPSEPSLADKHAFLQALGQARERFSGSGVHA
ncbi:MAG: flagellar biosynthetic protein FliO [Planctomycetes bacterium]|nr:flagellar biosynthetic protein FliO [Planctomycetota bacterium]